MDALLLDFNGVVVNDEPLHYATFADVLHEEGIVLDRDDYNAEFLGLGTDWIAFRHAFHRAGQSIEPHRVNALVERKAQRYAELARRELTLVPGVTDFVRAAAAQARVAVASGALHREVLVGLDRAGLRDVVETVVAAEDVRTGKPDPEGFRLALRRLAGNGTAPQRAVVIEDSLPGLAAARALGAGCIMITSTHQAAELSGADAVWQSFEGHGPGELAPLWREVRP